jgi:hypothetical protein
LGEGVIELCDVAEIQSLRACCRDFDIHRGTKWLGLGGTFEVRPSNTHSIKPTSQNHDVCTMLSFSG